MPPCATACCNPPIFLDSSTLHSLLPPSSLIPHLLSSLPSLSPSITSPPRLVLPLHPPPSSSSLLLMPSWSSSPSLPYISVKILTSFPLNPSLPLPLPSLSSSFLLLSSSTGSPLASLDGSSLTLLRTSASSALASLFLSRPDSLVLVMLGAGALAPHLIRAHLFVRPLIRRVVIWNRSPSKAAHLAQLLAEEEKEAGRGAGRVAFEVGENLDDAVAIGDIVSCATGSRDPLVRGGMLKPGAHLDLVGSFSAEMRECDDEALARGRVFVDFEAAMEEAGELLGAFERGVISREDVVGTLADLAGGARVGRRSAEEITVFKSVGTAVLDLLAGQLAYETFVGGSH